MAQTMRAISDILEEYEFLEGDERYRLLIELGRELSPMPDALKTDATMVRGCSASVWVYPTSDEGQKLHFLADSNAAIAAFIAGMVPAFLTGGGIVVSDQDLGAGDALNGAEALDLPEGVKPGRYYMYRF